MAHQKSQNKITTWILGRKPGIAVRILNYGCIITDIIVPDREGRRENIVLRLKNDQAYTSPHPYLGATVGRYSNRIANGKFQINNRVYKLSVNETPNHLHGGKLGFDKKIWKCTALNDRLLELAYTSNDGEEGYPGILQAIARFELTSAMELTITYRAETSKTTPVSITNHNYFNLTGNPENPIHDHVLQIHAEKYTPAVDAGIPDGDIRPVADSPFDFREPRAIGKSENESLGGYDLNYALRLRGEDKILLPAARLHDPLSGRKMELLTDKPGMQFYTGGGLDGSLVDDQDRRLEQFSGLCLEPQFFPDSPNKPVFPSPFLEPGGQYNYRMIYRFSV